MLRIASMLLAALVLSACTTAGHAAPEGGDGRTKKRYESWRLGQVAAVRDFEQFLAREGLREVAPLHELLRSASMWRECEAQPYEVPPPAQWPAAAEVLRLLRHLRASGVLPDFEVVSAYRNPTLNRCSGGAPRSAHVRFAVDLAPLPRADALRLCEFWRREGGKWQMGLSRYPTGRVHIDRSAWRTWGADHTRKTSFCMAMPASKRRADAKPKR